MNILKPNTESTALDRARIVIGTLLVLAGIAVIALIFISGNTDSIQWIIALGLVVAGILVTGLHKITVIILDLLR